MNNPNPIIYKPSEGASDVTDPLIIEIYDLIRDIKDPEHPHTLEELNVVSEDGISVEYKTDDGRNGTSSHGSIPPSTSPSQVPHCSLATLIGLCLRIKLERTLMQRHKLDIIVEEGTHSIEGDVNKQINDKERVAAAMENPELRDMVEQCIRTVEY